MLEEEGVKSKGRIAKVTKTNEHDTVKKAAMRKMKSKSKRTEAPTYEQQVKSKLRIERETQGKHPNQTEMPLIDSQACDPLFAPKIKKHLVNIKNLPKPANFETVDGVTSSTQTADLPGEIPIKKGYILSKAKESVVPTKLITKLGYTYVEDDKGAALVKGEEVYECPPAKQGYSLPQENAMSKTQALGVLAATIKYRKK